jgi:hypothetical protein
VYAGGNSVAAEHGQLRKLRTYPTYEPKEKKEEYKPEEEKEKEYEKECEKEKKVGAYHPASTCTSCLCGMQY